MNETEVMIEVRELEKLFSLKGHERMFNNLFRSYGDKIVMLTAASRIKIWLEYVGYVGEYDAYKQQTELAKKYIDSEFKEIKGSVDWVMDIPNLNFLTRFSTSKFYFDLNDKTDLFSGIGFHRQFKREKDLQKSIFETLHWLSDEFKTEKEKKLKNGVCDLFLTYKDGSGTAIELKRGKALKKDVFQAYSYESLGSDVALIAKSFPDDVLELAEKLEIPCYCYVLENSQVPLLMFMEKMNNKECGFDEVINSTSECDNFIVEYPFEKESRKMVRLIEKKLKAEDDNLKLLMDCLKAKTGYEV